MKSGEPFALAAIWESWRHPETDEIVRTFCVITTTANELVADIHDRMPVILPPGDLRPLAVAARARPARPAGALPAEPMTMWPISTRVNKPDNDDAAILERTRELAGPQGDARPQQEMPLAANDSPPSKGKAGAR